MTTSTVRLAPAAKLRAPRSGQAPSLRGAIARHFPRIALVIEGQADLPLVDRVVRINPDVKIFALDQNVIEPIKAKYYVTPIPVRGALASEAQIARSWKLDALISATPDGGVRVWRSN